jgi:hypothetical protein
MENIKNNILGGINWTFPLLKEIKTKTNLCETAKVTVQAPLDRFLSTNIRLNIYFDLFDYYEYY